LVAAAILGWMSYDHYASATKYEGELNAAKEKEKKLSPGRSVERERVEIDLKTLPPLVQQMRDHGLWYAIAAAAAGVLGLGLIVGSFVARGRPRAAGQAG
jgi:hypothetical protein